MKKRNQQNSQQNLRGAIGSAVERKQHELKLLPTTEDHEKVSGQMMELFFDNKKIYYHEEHIFPALKLMYKNDPIYDRVSLKGRDEILSVLKEKIAIKEYWTVERHIKYDKYGRIKSIGEPYDPRDRGGIWGNEWNQIRGKIKLYRYTTKDEAYRDKLAYEAKLEEMERENERSYYD